MTRKTDTDPTDGPSDDIWKEPELGPGYRTGDVPGGIDWPISFWVIRVPNPSKVQVEIVQAIRSELARRGIRLGNDLASSQSNSPGEENIPVLKPSDAKRLYQTIHRRRVVVLSVGGARVQNDPTEVPTKKDSQLLEHFISQKAAFQRVTRVEEVSRSIDACLSWWEDPPQLRSLSDEPRLLPAVCFSGLDGYESLGSLARFDADHDLRPWTDKHGKQWVTATDMHTVELLHVAGTTLPIGFHWDVQLRRGRSVVMCAWERWEGVTNYVNIHPNAHIRPGPRNGRKVFDCESGTIGDKPRRTAARKRKGRR
ncbi:hypothetical protein [Rhodococcus sp. IEGM1428]|uniref:hypothetical protein n=1 Tax=Rhodococcus sp. IEGM1428 TaxID=3392191 RepID=UPI003D11DC57